MAVVPHGAITVPDLEYSTIPSKTIEGFLKIYSNCENLNIDYYLIIDPHDKIYRSFSFVCANTYKGYWQHNNKEIKKEYKSNLDINNKLHRLNNSNLEFIRKDVHDISWGAFVPAWHLNKKNTEIGIMSINRKVPIEVIKDTGYKIFELLNSCSQNICIIFSCDLAHTHSKITKNFPYNENSIVYDNYVTNLLIDNQIENYNNIDINIVNQARTDAHAQLTMLAGICKNIKYKSIVYSYEVPTYFGMLVSSVELI